MRGAPDRQHQGRGAEDPRRVYTGGETPQELAHLPLGELDLQSTEYQGGTKND